MGFPQAQLQCIIKGRLGLPQARLQCIINGRLGLPQAQLQCIPAEILYSVSDPSKHSGSGSHQIRIGSEALAGSGPDDACAPACFRTNSVWPKPDTVSSQEQSGSGLVLHSRIRAVCRKTQPRSENGKLVAGWSRSARNPAR